MMRLTKIGLRLGMIMIVLIIIYAGIALVADLIKDTNEDYSLEYFSVIDDIKISDNRATPSFLLDNEWKYLGGYGRLIVPFVQKGDSIAKRKESSIMKVYRKNEFGRYKMLRRVDL